MAKRPPREAPPHVVPREEVPTTDTEADAPPKVPAPRPVPVPAPRSRRASTVVPLPPRAPVAPAAPVAPVSPPKPARPVEPELPPPRREPIAAPPAAPLPPEPSVVTTGPEASAPDVAALPVSEPAPLPAKKRVRLSRAHLAETITRMAYERANARRHPGVLHASQAKAALVELMVVRERDAGQRAVRVGKDGVRVFGEAVGADRDGERATLMVVVDGVSYSSAVAPGASPMETLEQLATRVRAVFETELHDEDGAAFLRFSRYRSLM